MTLFDGAVVTDDGLDRGLWFDEEIAPGVLLLGFDGLREDREEVSLLCLSMVMSYHIRFPVTVRCR